MADFPVLTRLPSFNIEPDGSAEDAVIRQGFEGGYEITRPRFTYLRKQWGLRYILHEDDLTALRDFERDTLNGGADAFNWNHPLDVAGIVLVTETGEEINTEIGESIYDEASTISSYFVRFTAPLSISYFAPGLWTVSFALKEI